MFISLYYIHRYNLILYIYVCKHEYIYIYSCIYIYIYIYIYRLGMFFDLTQRSVYPSGKFKALDMYICVSCVCRVFIYTWDVEVFQVALTQSFVFAGTEQSRIYPRHFLLI